MGLSRKEIAARAGISYPYLSQLETGARQGSPKALWAVADALGMRHHELQARAEDAEPPGVRVDRAARVSELPDQAGDERHGPLGRLAALSARVREALAGASPEEAEAVLLMSLGEQRERASDAARDEV